MRAPHPSEPQALLPGRPLGATVRAALLLGAGVACTEPTYKNPLNTGGGDGGPADTAPPTDSGDGADGGGDGGADGGAPVDTDGDGVPDTDDCRPEDPTIYPAAEEIPYDGIDQDCFRGDLRDVDEDGHEAEVVGGDDCDDNDPDVHPSVEDLGNDRDDDCDGDIDEDEVVFYTTWPVHLGLAGASAAGELVRTLSDGRVALQARYSGEIDINPDPTRISPRPDSGPGDEAIVVVMNPDRTVSFDFALHGDDDFDVLDIAADGGGATLVAGRFTGTLDFDDATPTYLRVSNGAEDGFFGRFSSTGALAWGYGLGGAGEEGVGGVYDPGDGAIIAGWLQSANLNPAGTAPEAVNRVAAGELDAFVARYDLSRALSWSALIAGQDAGARSAFVRVGVQDGVLWLIGTLTGSADADPGAGEQLVHAAGDQDLLLVALDPSDGAYIDALTLGGAGARLSPEDAAFAADGSLAVSGRFSGAFTAGTTTLTAAGGEDAFALRFDAGRAVTGAWRFGGAGDDRFDAVTFAPGSSDLVVSGSFSGSASSPDAALTATGGADCAALRLGATRWALGYGSAADDACPGLAADPAGDLWIGGVAGGTINFGSGGDTDRRPIAGDQDAFLHRLPAAP